MLQLPTATLDAIYAHAETAWPAECCGLLLGRREGDSRHVAAHHPATNHAAAQRNDRYEIGADDRQAAEKAAAAAGLSVVGFYHSHPDHDSYFSRTDLHYSEEYQWGEPWIPATYAYLVISIHGGRRDHYKSFLIDGGQAVADPVALLADAAPT